MILHIKNVEIIEISYHYKIDLRNHYLYSDYFRLLGSEFIITEAAFCPYLWENPIGSGLLKKDDHHCELLLYSLDSPELSYILYCCIL